jgi:hypothetical protein
MSTNDPMLLLHEIKSAQLERPSCCQFLLSQLEVKRLQLLSQIDEDDGSKKRKRNSEKKSIFLHHTEFISYLEFLRFVHDTL